MGLVVAWRMISGLLGRNVRLSGIWRVYLASGVSAVVTLPVSFLQLHPILATLTGGVLFLLVLIPLLVWTRAATREDVSALESYSSKLGPASFLFRQVARYQSFFDRKKSSETQDR